MDKLYNLKQRLRRSHVRILMMVSKESKHNKSNKYFYRTNRMGPMFKEKASLWMYSVAFSPTMAQPQGVSF